MKELTDLQKLIGTWRLISSRKTLESGEIIDMYGKNPVGYILFAQDMMMSVQIMRRERTGFHGESLLNDYLAYTGPYYVDEPKKILGIHVDASLSEIYYAKELERKYTMEGNRLILKVLEYPLDYILTWERIA